MRAARRPDPIRELKRLTQPRRAAPLPGAPPACRAYRGADQALVTGTLTEIDLSLNRWDTDTMHFTSNANLTGTVAKTAGGNTLTGTGTAFLSELAVGQAIDVPGTTTERAVIIAIASNTSATVAVGGAGGTWANTASGQTATRVRAVLVANTPGLYEVTATVRFATNATGRRIAQLAVGGNAGGGTLIDQDARMAVTDALSATSISLATEYRFSQWDYVALQCQQNSGGNLNVTATPAISPEVTMSRRGPA